MMAHVLKLVGCAGALALAAAIAPASAQTATPAETKGPASTSPTAPKVTPAPAAPKTAKQSASSSSKSAAKEESGAGSRPAGDSALRQRVEQLEEQLTDMQVMIGTLESLGKGGSPAAAASGAASDPGRGPRGGGVDEARLDSLETQMRAISDQLEQLAAQVRQLSGRRGELPPAAAPPATEPPAKQAAVAEPPRAGGFGSMTVTPGGQDRDPIGSLINAPPQAGAPLPPPVANAGNPKELYETAYGYLLQQDYAAAEVAFEEFLRRHPNDRLAADAQYWLGEALYVQRRYKPAGQAFLRVIEKHQTSNKVPNSILKLAMTLDQLGQKDCALFDELETRHPNAPADVKSKARALKQRVGC